MTGALPCHDDEVCMHKFLPWISVQGSGTMRKQFLARKTPVAQNVSLLSLTVSALNQFILFGLR